jgi:3-methyladenine DNA glycosylase AlkD
VAPGQTFRGAKAPKAALAAALIERIEAAGSEESRRGMARYGINVERAAGVSVYELRRIARELGRDHELALALWASGSHEARLLASMVDDPAQVDAGQMDAWVVDFDSWDVCDQVTSNLFDKAEPAYVKAREWCGREREFEKRAGFAMIAALAVQDKRARDELFIEFLELVRREAGDERNYVKKAVNWALRNIGKRDPVLHAAAVRCARRLLSDAEGGAAGARSARWIANDALRELTSEKVLRRLERQNG